MKLRFLVPAVSLAFALLAATLPDAAAGAQWLKYRVPGVPRTKTGEVDVDAPAPKAGRHPDLSGLWFGNPDVA